MQKISVFGINSAKYFKQKILALVKDYLPLSGGVLTGKLSVNGTAGDSLIETNGNINIGSKSEDYESYVATSRLCVSDDSAANSVKISVTEQGQTKISHIRAGVEDSYILFDSSGLTCASSGTKSVEPISSSQILNSSNLDSVTLSSLDNQTLISYIKSLEARISALESA